MSSECYQCMGTLHSTASSPVSVAPVAMQPFGHQPPPQPVSPRSHGVAFILSVFLGSLGLDRLYLGKIGTGLLKMASFLALPVGILVALLAAKAKNFELTMAVISLVSLAFTGNSTWSLIDVLQLGAGSVKDKDGLPLLRSTELVGTPHKEQSVAFGLSFFLGGFGAADFYLGHTGRGLAKLGLVFGPLLLLPWLIGSFFAPVAIACLGLPALIAGIWNTVDMMRIGLGKGRDAQGNSLVQPSAGPRIAAQPVYMLPAGFQQQAHPGAGPAWGNPTPQAHAPMPPASPTAPQ